MLERSLPALIAIALSLSCAQAAQAPVRRSIVMPRAPAAAALPFSDAVLVGDVLYLSGKIGLDDTGKVPATAEEEARRVMDSMKATLSAAGLTMDDLVYVQVFCSDLSLYAEFNAIYRTYFQSFPARAFIGSGSLLFNARFEVQGIAVARNL
jgi:2-iminobutanoate/2-iminopropanoate deaminase